MKDWGQEEKEATEDELVGWYHRSMDMSLSKVWNSKGQGSLACCSSWGGEASDTTQQLNNSKKIALPDGVSSLGEIIQQGQSLPVYSDSTPLSSHPTDFTLHFSKSHSQDLTALACWRSSEKGRWDFLLHCCCYCWVSLFPVGRTSTHKT